ncbi:hypothetical protein C8R46DRAFT_1044859 [Mycena filopes]|nr:hypothetical protein C8R46DRAFT_1044859 [Mycena filopes]
MSFNLGGINGSVTISGASSSTTGGFNLGGINASSTTAFFSAPLPLSTATFGSFNLGGINASADSTSASPSGSAPSQSGSLSAAPSSTAAAPNGGGLCKRKAHRAEVGGILALALMSLLVLC